MISRRSLLRVIAPALGVAAGGLVGVSRLLPSGQAASSGRVRATHWTDPSGVLASTPQDGNAPSTYTSRVFHSPHPFNGIGSFWNGTIDALWIRTGDEEPRWTEWQRVTTGEMDGGPPDRVGRTFGDLVTLTPSRYVQYRYSVPAGGPPVAVTLVLMDSTEGPQVTGPIGVEQGRVGVAASSRPPIISRAGWGCDESYRYENGVEVWPREYRVLQKAVVHHTATRNDYADPAREVRLIYYYHAVTRGWGDIGYNFLIDKWGNIYEGRAGGDRVVAGHVLGYNYGSMGIACIGTYGPGGSFEAAYPSAGVKTALATLIAWKCCYIDPHGQTYFVDRYLPNIMGHRDAQSNICPGDSLYAHLQGLRGDVLSNLGGKAQTPRPNGQIRSVAFNPTLVPPNSDVRIEITVENTGTGVMVTQGPAPGYPYQEGRNFQVDGYSEILGAWRVGVDFAGDTSGLICPLRWGLADALEPGQSTTVAGYIRLSTPQIGDFWAGLVQEGYKWSQTNVGTTSITVGQSPTPTPTCIPRPTPAPPAPPNPSLQRRAHLPLVSSGNRRYCE